MSRPLDILALEPFYGGIRRHMLETVIRCSRHHWTLLKLPPRRIERRLMAAAHWFAEQLSRHWVGRTDVVFTSEAMNLADLLRRVPALARKPAVVYFHSNQLPLPEATQESPWELVNLSSATAATEIWFNSLYHLRTFLSRATSLVGRHPELSGRNPLPELTGKAQLIRPPLDIAGAQEGTAAAQTARRKRIIFVDTRDANAALLNTALATVQRRGERFLLVTVGPVDQLAADLPRRTIAENDPAAQLQAVREAGVILSTKPAAPCDHYAVLAMAAGCWPLLPQTGVYPELLPECMHRWCLHNGTSDQLVSRLLDAWDLERPGGYQDQLSAIIGQFDPAVGCRIIDDRLEQLAGATACIQVTAQFPDLVEPDAVCPKAGFSRCSPPAALRPIMYVMLSSTSIKQAGRNLWSRQGQTDAQRGWEFFTAAA